MIFCMTATMAFAPTTLAHSPAWQIQTWSYISASPETVGVGQPTLIVVWCNLIPPTAAGQYGDRYTFNVNVITPSGSNETLGPYISDPVGGTYFSYTPTEVGNYTLQAFMQQQVLNGQPLNPAVSTTSQSGYAYWGDTLLASISSPETLTVQDQASAYLPRDSAANRLLDTTNLRN